MKLLPRILTTSILLMSSYPAVAQGVEPKVHQMCVEAKDYAGCVRAMTTNVSAPPVQRLINSQGADIAEGNQCPAGWAYVGGGNCQEVKCVYNTATGLGFDTGHDQRVAGKSNWRCKGSFWYGAGVMQLVGNARTSINPDCPPGEPKIGYNSTCTASSLTTNGNGRKADTSDWNSDSPLDYVPHEEL